MFCGVRNEGGDGNEVNLHNFQQNCLKSLLTKNDYYRYKNYIGKNKLEREILTRRAKTLIPICLDFKFGQKKSGFIEDDKRMINKRAGLTDISAFAYMQTCKILTFAVDVVNAKACYCRHGLLNFI